MNERIRELAQQSDGIVICKMMTGRKQYTFLEEDLEKFAELIVKECANVASDAQEGAHPWHYSRLIQEHFGVE